MAGGYCKYADRKGRLKTERSWEETRELPGIEQLFPGSAYNGEQIDFLRMIVRLRTNLRRIPTLQEGFAAALAFGYRKVDNDNGDSND